MKKLNHIPRNLLHAVTSDARYYICILASFVVGGVFAAVFAFSLSELSCKELLLYLGDFFQTIDENGADAAALFKASLILNLKNVGFLFFVSVMVIGAPFVAAFVAVKGFMHCFTLFFMFRLYGIRTLLFFGVGMLPHYLLLIPCYLFLCVVCLKFSITLVREKHELKRILPRFILMLSCLFAVSIMASLLQAYVEPLLIRLISGLYI